MFLLQYSLLAGFNEPAVQLEAFGTRNASDRRKGQIGFANGIHLWFAYIKFNYCDYF